MKECHLVVEPSAAAAIAALLEKTKLRAGEKVVVVVSGGNISLKILGAVLSKHN
jgi:threonine dehydratase